MHAGDLKLVRRALPALEPRLGASVHPVLQRIYASRGIVSSAQLGLALNGLLPIGSLEAVDAAAQLLAAHQRPGASVLVIGDFDADGATSTVVIVRALRSWGFAAVDFLVPNRFEFGYGLTPGNTARGMFPSAGAEAPASVRGATRMGSGSPWRDAWHARETHQTSATSTQEEREPMIRAKVVEHKTITT